MNLAVTAKRLAREARVRLGEPSGIVTRLPQVTGLWLVIAVALSVVLALVHSPLLPLPGVVTMLLVPGATVMSVLRTRPSSAAGRIILAVCLSLSVIMVVGCIASLIGPDVGVTRPLDPLPESLIWLLLGILGLTFGTRTRRDPVAWVVEGVRLPQLYVVFSTGLLVIMSILGVAQLNHSGDNHLAILTTVLVIVVLLAGIVGGWNRESRWPFSALLYSASLALLLSASLRGGHLYGWDIQKEYGVASHTISSGRWAIPANGDPYASMLSLTVLPAVLASLVKLRLLAFFQLVVPAVLALMPVAVFVTIRGVPRLITILRPTPRPGVAFAVATAFIVSSEAFSSELVSITRQAMALTMLTTLVMVIYDRTMLKRPSQVIIGILIGTIAFTHYTTSYLLAGILSIAWLLGFVWSQGLLGAPKAMIVQRRSVIGPRRVINVTLVVVAMVTAFGWNLGFTRNYALNSASNAVTTKGAGFSTSTGPEFVSAPKLEEILTSELHKSASWLVPVPGSNSVRLETASGSSANNSTSALAQLWSFSNFLLQESLWLVSGVALLYGLAYLGRRQVNHYSPDLVGFTAAVLLIGGFLRFSATLAAFYSPSRAAIFVAIFVAAPVTMFLDDCVANLNGRLTKLSIFVGVAAVGTMTTWATGLGALLFGGVPPGSLTANGVNAQNFTVSTSELATAVWIRDNVEAQGVVQTDEYGQLVMLSEPSKYDLIDEIVPSEVGRGSYIYLSTTNLLSGLTTVTASGGNLYTSYKSTVSFFNRNFNVVFSTGGTRVYH